MELMIEEDGEYKMITNIETGKTHKIPTSDIIEFGINFADLAKYPIFEKDTLRNKITKWLKKNKGSLLVYGIVAAAFFVINYIFGFTPW